MYQTAGTSESETMPGLPLWESETTFNFGGKVEASYAMRIPAVVSNWWVSIAIPQVCGVQQNKRKTDTSHSSNGYKYRWGVMLHRRESSVSAGDRLCLIY